MHHKIKQSGNYLHQVDHIGTYISQIKLGIKQGEQMFIYTKIKLIGKGQVFKRKTF